MDNKTVLAELAVAMLASAVENDEIFNVSKGDLEMIWLSISENKTWPVIQVFEDGDRIKYGVELVKLEEME